MVSQKNKKSGMVLKQVITGGLALVIVTGVVVLGYTQGLFGSPDSSGAGSSSEITSLSNSVLSSQSAITPTVTITSAVNTSSPDATPTSTPAAPTSIPATTTPSPTARPPTPTPKPPTPTTATHPSGTIIDHTYTRLAAIPTQYITAAKSQLHIAYGHTSHGSQLIDGMSGLISFKGSLFNFNSGGTAGALDVRDCPFDNAYDLGNPDFAAWFDETRIYLDANPAVNVVMWSWCGQVSWATQQDINGYLTHMNTLESEYPGVKFVYFTGHLDGSGLEGNLHARNEQIRAYCRSNHKILYDFADIESYNPDGTWFGDKHPTDACSYNGGNWAQEWQAAHPVNIDWYECGAAHTEPLNANQKAYAAWSLFARLAGWGG